MNKQEIQKAVNHLTMLRRLDSGEKKGLYDMAISALTQQLNNGWIPVSERLPDKVHDKYLVTMKHRTLNEYCIDYKRIHALQYLEVIKHAGNMREIVTNAGKIG
ncbi:MAG: hypothetical protein GX915_06105 [Clostridiales bacterium]|nr:hypothetical protein [Clostridiales bacterium]